MAEPPLPLVHVYWDDSHGGCNEEQEPGEGKIEPAHIKTTGYITDMDEQGLRIAPEQTSATHYRGHTTVIGWGNVYDIRIVRRQADWKRPQRRPKDPRQKYLDQLQPRVHRQV